MIETRETSAETMVGRLRGLVAARQDVAECLGRRARSRPARVFGTADSLGVRLPEEGETCWRQ